MESDRFFKVGVGCIVVFVCGVVLKLAKPVIVPFCLAVFLSYLISPVLSFLTRSKVPRVLSLVVLLLVTSLILSGFGLIFYAGGKSMASSLPDLSRNAAALVESLGQKFHLSGARENFLTWIKTLDADRVAAFLVASLGPLFSFLSELLLIIIFLAFILAGRGRLRQKVVKAFSPARAGKTIQAIENIDFQIQKYLVIKTLMSIVTGLLVTGILALFRVPFAVVFGFLAFLLNYIPTLGSIVATVLPALTAFLQCTPPITGLWVLIILMVTQFGLGNFLEPKLMGKGLDLSPLLVVFSLLFWGWLWGISGLVLAVPMMAVLKIVAGNIPSLKPLETAMSK